MNINLTLKIPLPSENGPGLYKSSSSEPLSHRNSVDMPGIKAFQDTQASHLKRYFMWKGMHSESMKNNSFLHAHTNSDLTTFSGLQSSCVQGPWHSQVGLTLGKLVLPFSENLNYKAGHTERKPSGELPLKNKQTNMNLLPHCLDSHQPAVSYWEPRRMCLKMRSFLHWRKIPFRVIKPRALYSTTTPIVPGLRMPPFLFGE